MSVFKAVSYRGNLIDSIPDKIAYLIDPAKTSPFLLHNWISKEVRPAYTPPQLIMSWIGPQCFYDFQFFSDVILSHQKQCGDVWKKAYDHFIIRFDKKADKVGPHEIIAALNDLFFLFCHHTGGQYAGLMVVHFDTVPPHAHFLVDTLDLRTGHRRNLNLKQFYALRLIISRILHSHGITPLKMKIPKHSP